ncbi:MAG: HAD family hydrolase [bacterium]|nr:HAD family hydrolase [bacterium]
MKKPQAILFDMGGVLQDASDSYTLESFPLSFPDGLSEEAPVEWFVGMSVACLEPFLALVPPRPAMDFSPIVGDWLARRGIEPSPDAIAHWLGVMEQWEARPIYPHVKSTLETLHARGYRLGVVSNTMNAASYLRGHFREAGIRDFFEVTVFSPEVGVNKPDPAIFHQALDAMGVEPAQAWYVGDKPQRDICGAHRAGMTAVLVDSAHTDRINDGPEYVPDYSIRDIAALPALLDELFAAEVGETP